MMDSHEAIEFAIERIDNKMSNGKAADAVTMLHAILAQHGEIASKEQQLTEFMDEVIFG